MEEINKVITIIVIHAAQNGMKQKSRSVSIVTILKLIQVTAAVVSNNYCEGVNVGQKLNNEQLFVYFPQRTREVMSNEKRQGKVPQK